MEVQSLHRVAVNTYGLIGCLLISSISIGIALDSTVQRWRRSKLRSSNGDAPMKKATMQNKLVELLGLSEEFKVDPKTGKKKNLNSKLVEVPEAEISNFRAVQGVLYALQAPELFTYRLCPHCGADFMVSRQFVAFCSYTCIRKDLESKGLSWTKGNNIEEMVKQVYDGQEPIWIPSEMIERLRTILQSEPKVSLLTSASENQSSQVSTSNPESLSSLPVT